MRISVVRALDHFISTERKDLRFQLIDVCGEIFREDEDYLILRSFNCYDKDKPDDNPNERFLGVTKATIIKRIDIDIDLESEAIIATKVM